MTLNLTKTLESALSRRDAVRREPQVRIRFECVPLTQSVCGQLCHQGTNEIVIYKDRLAEAQALVEKDTAEIDRIVALRQQAFASYSADFCRRNKVSECPTPWLDVPKGYDGVYMSVASAFQSRNGRDILPLRALEIVEDNLPAPESEDERIRRLDNATLGTAIGQAIREALTAPAAQPPRK